MMARHAAVNATMPPLYATPSARTRTIRRQIARLDLLCSGTLLARTKVCGKPTCRCATDPAAAHGPYYEWRRREEGALRHRIVTADEARLIAHGQENYQRLLTLLADWEIESLKAILGPERLTSRLVRR
jgi:hypothetical protein